MQWGLDARAPNQETNQSAPRLSRRGFWWAALWWMVAVLSGLAIRPLLPLDETRYTAVAWEMRTTGEWLVPHLNGATYHHKPPLLFWLMNIAWAGWGVSEFAARVVAPCFGLASLAGTWALARRMWPDRPRVAFLAPLLLVGCVLFTLFSSLIFFDLPLTFSVLLAWLGLWRAAHGQRLSGWLGVAAGLGLGALFKGPVVLLPVVWAAVLAPYWKPVPIPSWSNWYGSFLLAILAGAALALAWALPAAQAGGPEFARMLFFGQHAGRVVNSFQHAKPLWWYLVLLPVLIFPWTFWGGLWRGGPPSSQLRTDPGVRFVGSVVTATVFTFSLISGKQPQYLLPIFPLLALGLAHRLDTNPPPDRRRDRAALAALALLVGLAVVGVGIVVRSRGWPETWPPLPEPAREIAPGWGLPFLLLGAFYLLDRPRSLESRVFILAGFPALVLLFAQAAFFQAEREKYDLTPTALQVARVQSQGRPVAILGGYEGQFTFLGRLTQPLTTLTEKTARAWAETHPDGLIVAIHRRPRDLSWPRQPEFVYPHRGRHCLGWRASDLVQMGDEFLRDVPRSRARR